jgi:dTDP-glucose pyrophosphorylase
MSQSVKSLVNRKLPELTLIMPMAGRGSRFAQTGTKEPKPLIEIYGRPFFWWAVESIKRAARLKEIIFVILDEHCDQFGMHKRIAEYYPEAKIIQIPDVTSGAAETAQIGLTVCTGEGPVAINDCDHVFICPDLTDSLQALSRASAGVLICFHSNSPAYSYVKVGEHGEILGTVEKEVVSPFAIAGCYLFASAATYRSIYSEYQNTCKYKELYISGLFDMLIAKGKSVLKIDAECHCAFGTPVELEKINDAIFQRYRHWTDPI